MAAGDAERRTGDEHARTFDVAGVDAIAQGDVGVVAGADIADGGESGVHGEARVLGADDGFTWHRDAQARVATAHGIAGEVRVHVDQAGEAGRRGEIDGGASGGKRGTCWADCGDRAIGVEHDDLIFEEFAGAHVEELAAADGAGRGVSERRECSQQNKCEKKSTHQDIPLEPDWLNKTWEHTSRSNQWKAVASEDFTMKYRAHPH